MPISRFGDTTTTLEENTQDSGRHLATDVSQIGDVNGDGLDDFALLSRPVNSLSGGSSAHLFVIYGDENGYAPDVNLALDGVVDGFTVTYQNPTPGRLTFGSAGVEGIGDFNGDGYDDMLVADDLALVGDSYNTGEAYIILGGAATPSEITITPSDHAHASVLRLDAATAAEGIGSDIAGAGDVDGDGFDDFLISTVSGHGGAGAVYLVYGRADVGADITLSAGEDISFIGGAQTGGNFGAAVSGIGDIDDDGFADFAIGESGADIRREVNGVDYTFRDAGRVHILYGREERDLGTEEGLPGFYVINQDTDQEATVSYSFGSHVVLSGRSSSDLFGAQIAGDGDTLLIAAASEREVVEGVTHVSHVYHFDVEAIRKDTGAGFLHLSQSSRYGAGRQDNRFGTELEILGDGTSIIQGRRDVYILSEGSLGEMDTTTDLTSDSGVYKLGGTYGLFDVAALGDIDGTGSAAFAIATTNIPSGSGNGDDFRGEVLVFYGADPTTPVETQLAALLSDADRDDGTEDGVIDMPDAFGLGAAFDTTGTERPDLTVSNLDATGDLIAGRDLMVSFDIANIGQASGDGQVSVYLTSQDLEAPVLLGTIDGSTGIAPGASETRSFAVTLPATLASGDYALQAQVDVLDLVEEESETNNSSTELPLTIAAAVVDLSVSNVFVPDGAEPGDTVTFAVDVTNTGNTAATAPVSVSIIRPSGASLQRLAERSDIDDIAPGQTVRVEVQATLPSDAVLGDWRALAYVDRANDIAEPDENNNVSFPYDFHIGSVDFAPQLHGFEVLTHHQDFSILPNTPIGDRHAFLAGQSFGVSWYIENLGSRTEASPETNLYLTSNTSDSERYDLGGILRTSEIASQDRILVEFERTLRSDLAPGDYTLWIETDPDGTVTESDETNNRLSLDVRIEDQTDFRSYIDDVTVNGQNYIYLGQSDNWGYFEPGAEMVIHARFQNKGNVIVKSIPYIAYLTPDPDDLESYRILGREDVTYIYPETYVDPSYTIDELTVTLPEDLDRGEQYYLFLYSYPNGFEDTDPTNNDWLSHPFQVIKQDLAISGLSLSANAVATHSDWPVLRWNIENLGNVVNDTVPIWLSIHEVNESGQHVLVHQDKGYSAVETQVGESLRYRPPSGLEIPEDLPLGSYFLTLTVDPANELNDTDRSNNAASIPFTLAGADLVADELTLSDSVMIAGAGLAVTAQFDLDNIGLDKNVPAVPYQLVMSSDGTLDANDMVLASGFTPSRDRNTFGQQIQTSFVIPQTLPLGEYFIGVRLDPDGTIKEENTDNNTSELTPFSVVVDLTLQSTDGDDVILDGPDASQIDAGDGDDTVRSGGGDDIVTLGNGADTLSGSLAHLLGDRITDFDEADLIEILSADIDRSQITVTQGSAILGIDGDSDGTTDGDITLDGDFTHGDFMAVRNSTNTQITFETFLPALQEGQAIDPTLINGIMNQNFLQGDGASDFKVTLHDMGYAGYNNVVGAYEIDAGGNIVDTRLLFKNANSDKSAVAGITDVEAGNKIGFFLVQDAADWAATLADGDTLSFVNSSGDAANLSDGSDISIAVNGAAVDEMVFHSFSEDMNIDGVQHALSGVEVGGQSIYVGFEDLTGGGDQDYEDVVFRIDVVDEFMLA